MLCVASRCRVKSSHLADDVASGDMKSWTFLGALPSEADIQQMRGFYSILLGRILSVRMKWMTDYDLKSAVNWEIEHEYSKEQRQKSQEV